MKFLYSLLAKVLGRNLKSTPTNVIKDQMLEPRALPMGREAFEEWSNRIISGAMIPGEHLGFNGTFAEAVKRHEQQKIFHEGQKFALADMLMHLGPTESHKPDAHFIHSLRKFAINQVADTIRLELRKAAKDRLAAEEAAKKANDEANSGRVQESKSPLVQDPC